MHVYTKDLRISIMALARAINTDDLPNEYVSGLRAVFSSVFAWLSDNNIVSSGDLASMMVAVYEFHALVYPAASRSGMEAAIIAIAHIVNEDVRDELNRIKTQNFLRGRVKNEGLQSRIG